MGRGIDTGPRVTRVPPRASGSRRSLARLTAPVCEGLAEAISHAALADATRPLRGGGLAPLPRDVGPLGAPLLGPR